MDGEHRGIKVGQRKHGRGHVTRMRGEHEAEDSGGSSGREEESWKDEKNVAWKKIEMEGRLGWWVQVKETKKIKRIQFFKQDEQEQKQQQQPARQNNNKSKQEIKKSGVTERDENGRAEKTRD